MKPHEPTHLHLTGVFTAIVTPFTEKGELDEPALRAAHDRLPRHDGAGEVAPERGIDDDRFAQLAAKDREIELPYPPSLDGGLQHLGPAVLEQPGGIAQLQLHADLPALDIHLAQATGTDLVLIQVRIGVLRQGGFDRCAGNDTHGRLRKAE